MSRSAMPPLLLGLVHDLPQKQQVYCRPQRGPYVPHEQQNRNAVQTLEAERTFMMMIAKTNGISPGMSQAQKTFTSCRHRAGHQQHKSTSCRPSNTLLRQQGQHRPAGDESDRCTDREQPSRHPVQGDQNMPQSQKQPDLAADAILRGHHCRLSPEPAELTLAQCMALGDETTTGHPGQNTHRAFPSGNIAQLLTEAIAGFWRKATRATVSDHHSATEMGRHRSPITPAALMQQASTAPKLPLP